MSDQAKNQGGRPPMYETPEALQEKIDEYFISGVAFRTVVLGPKNARYEIEMPVPTITGLLLYLGFASRQSFYDLEKDDRFSYTIKRARSRIEREYEEQLQIGAPAGAIFALKNFGWKDEQTINADVTNRVVQMPTIEIDGKPKEYNIGN